MIVFMILLWQMKVSRERQSDTFLTVQSVKWCDVWQHTRTRGHPLLYVLTLRMSASGVQTCEAAEKSLLFFQQTCVVPCVVQYIHIKIWNIKTELQGCYLLESFTLLWFGANTDESTVLFNSGCVVSASKTVLPIAPPSSSLTTVNHCVHTHGQVAKMFLFLYSCIKRNPYAC